MSGPDDDPAPDRPLDVEIPDDARELDDDLRALRHERRMRRRAQRVDRITQRLGPLGPVLIGSLLMVMLAATMMIAFLPGQVANGPARSSNESPAPPEGVAGTVGAPLPDLRLKIGPGDDQLRNIENPAVLLLGGEKCRCDDLMATMARRARHPHGVAIYSAGHAPLSAIPIVPVEGDRGTLARTYHADGLTAVLVGHDGLVRGVRTNITDARSIESELPGLHD